MTLQAQQIKANRRGLGPVVIGSSAGGLAALTSVIGQLPDNFPQAVLVVQHLAKQYKSHMAEILARSSRLNVKQAEDGEKIEAGTVYIAPPDQHLLVNSDFTLSLSQAPELEFLRPSVNLLFKSAAAAYKNKLIAIILSGTGHDGAEGIHEVKEAGGLVIAQSEASAQFTGMPRSAIETGDVDLVLPLEQIAESLVQLTEQESSK